ncbi:MAG TPA: hypothetical protein VGE72_08335 [Azospirillum sp.]
MALRYAMLSAALAMLVAPSGPALADWQYTRWGMTPDEVKAACACTMDVLTPEEIQQYTYGKGRALLKTTYTSGEHRFTARFVFGKSDGLLSRVELLLNADSDVFSLKRDLLEKYGKPSEEKKTKFSEMYWWHTPSGRVYYFLAGSIKTGFSGHIEYYAPRTSSVGGL